MTIDAYCNKLVKENYMYLDIDSSFRILDEKELNIIENIAVDEVFEEYFTKKYEKTNMNDFSNLIKAYADGPDLSILKKAVIDTADKAYTNSNPLKWLHDFSNNFTHINRYYEDIFKNFISTLISFEKDVEEKKNYTQRKKKTNL